LFVNAVPTANFAIPMEGRRLFLTIADATFRRPSCAKSHETSDWMSKIFNHGKHEKRENINHKERREHKKETANNEECNSRSDN